MIRLLISPDERNLIADIREIAFGEIFDVKAASGRLLDAEVTHKEANLIKALRDHGCLDKIIVHDNAPVSAEKAETTTRGRKYLKKLRF
jgi:hypothetical protein